MCRVLGIQGFGFEGFTVSGGRKISDAGVSGMEENMETAGFRVLVANR